MAFLSQEDIEDFKQCRWFIMHHFDKCSICGKNFEGTEPSYFGHLKDGGFAYTCEVCSSKLEDAKVYTNNHQQSHKIPAPEAKLWRYMDLAKFLSLLEDSSLFFTRLDHFKDPFEGAIGTQKNEKAWAEKEKKWRMKWIVIEGKSSNVKLGEDELQLQAEQKLKEFRNNIKNWRTQNYVSCWYHSDTESEAMWQLYSRDTKQGIAIQTTFERLYQALPATPQPYFGLVNYVDFNDYNNGISSHTFHSFDSPWYKRESFAHEKEFRIIIEDSRKPGFGDWDKKIRVDLNMLIENVYISPEADEWFARLVRDIIRNRYNLWLNVCQSSLNETPFF